MKIFAVKNLDIKKVIPDYNKNYKEKYEWFIHTIIQQGIYHKDTDHHFVNLSSELLNKFIGERKLKEVKQHLLKSGIIEENPHYSAGNFSKSYRLAQKYHDSEMELIEIKGKKWKSYKKKVNYYQQLNLVHFNKQNFPYKLMYSNIGELLIDLPEASKTINSIKENDPLLGTEKFQKHKYFMYDMYAQMIQDRTYFFHPDKTTGRVYHNIANLPRVLRQYIYHHSGQHLMQVDIANSQPFLFIKLLKEYWLRKGKLPYFISQSTSDISNIYPQFPLYPPYVLTISPSLPKDVQLYIDLAKKGVLYEHLMEKFGIEQTKENRDAFKKEFFHRIFYSKINPDWQHDYAKKFKIHFPNVYEAVQWYKKDDYRQLPISLQTVESNLMISKACKRAIYELGDDVFIITLHDSIICFEKDAPKMELIIREETERVFGYSPKVKVSAFNC